jgi:hypothetical protein
MVNPNDMTLIWMHIIIFGALIVMKSLISIMRIKAT